MWTCVTEQVFCRLFLKKSDCGSEDFEKAAKLRSEFVVAVVGRVEKRAAASNENLATGDIEVRAEQIRILSEADNDCPSPWKQIPRRRRDCTLKYRYLDLRRPNLQKNLKLRSKITTTIRKHMDEEGFFEIETPMLCKSTPEGARDYLVSQPCASGQVLCTSPVPADCSNSF